MGILVFICITACLTMLDITLKSVIEGYLTRKEERTVRGGKIILRKVYNRGLCMNLLKDEPETVKFLSAYVTVVLTIYQLFTLLRKKHFCKKIGLSLLTAGAWSNTFDRWIRGYVIDYIGIQTKQKHLAKITFNLADLFIGAGTVIAMFCSVFHRKKK